MRHSVLTALTTALALNFPSFSDAARQPYDVRKIIDAFRRPREDLVVLCAHRGLRWNGTTENSINAYFRVAEAGIECIETDIRLSADGHLPMIHDSGLGRVTDVGEQTDNPAYSPFTGKGYDPKVVNSTYKGFMENLHLRDELGRVHSETVPTLPMIVESIRQNDINVVMQLDFKDKNAVGPAYWALKNLTNAAGVPANEWCIYKLQATWWKTPAELEAEDWVQDAFANGINLAYIPVYNPQDEAKWDTMSSVKAFARTNYTISAEIEVEHTGGELQSLLDYVQQNKSCANDQFSTAGIFYAPGDFTEQFTTELTRFDTGRFKLPEDISVNGSVYGFMEGKEPVLRPKDDKRSDLGWIIQSGFNWVILDVPDVLGDQLRKEGKRNVSYMLADGESLKDGANNGWYRRHVRNFIPDI